MLLSALLAPLLKYQMLAFADVDVQSITTDSRRAGKGSLFIAIRGYSVDGHQFVSKAVENGAVAVLVEESIANLAVPQIVVADTKKISAMMATVFYRHPSQQMSVIGVTGTNGKTTITHLVEAVLQYAGHKTGLMGTIENRIAGIVVPSVNTTPEAVELQALLHQMVEQGCQYGILEVSSHALDLGRVAGIKFHIGIFTNLTQDHLDFHESMDAYRHAKGKLFSRLGNLYADDKQSSAFAVLNIDDSATALFESETVMECMTYGIDHPADVLASNVQIQPEGVSFHVATFRGEADVNLQLTGRFNVYNALAAISVGLIEGIDLQVVVAALEEVVGVPGRLEAVICGQPYGVFVDYAHTPDSLQNALATIGEFAPPRIITVVGCGGDRDRTKRPLMAQVAISHSTVTILTSDNPRTENPEVILDHMERGVRASGAKYTRIVSRKEAIAYAIALAEPGDVVLIAGKGHENYQIVGHVKTHFDDREVAREAILARFVH